MTNLDQLLLNFKQKNNFDSDNFFVSKSNFLAYEILNKWPRWDNNILNIYGDKFSGKTHLANIFKKKSKTRYITEAELNDEIFKELKLYESLILDNFNNNVSERLLYTFLNFIDQSNKYLLITSEKPINNYKFELNDLKSRSKNCLFAKIEIPDDELILAIIIKNFSDKQIILEKKLIEFIIKRIDRSYSKIYDFIYKLDELSLKKKKPINLKIIKEILKVKN
tara:strand:- start:522 stop:1190 length:669 start_codon:yes stop_codon:yes gene_type:complete